MQVTIVDKAHMPLVAFSLKDNPVYTVFEVRSYIVIFSFEVTGYIFEVTPLITWSSLECVHRSRTS